MLESRLGDNCLGLLTRGLVRLRLMLVCRQLQDGRELACQQQSEWDNGAILKFERVMVRVGQAGIDLPEPRQLARRDRFLMRYWVFKNRCVLNASSVPGRRHTAVLMSTIPAKPRVIVLLNRVEMSWSATAAGREAMYSRL